MKKFWSMLLAVVIMTLIYFGINAIFGQDCDRCGDKIIGTKYHIQGTDKTICERCARYYK